MFYFFIKKYFAFCFNFKLVSNRLNSIGSLKFKCKYSITWILKLIVCFSFIKRWSIWMKKSRKASMVHVRLLLWNCCILQVSLQSVTGDFKMSRSEVKKLEEHILTLTIKYISFWKRELALECFKQCFCVLEFLNRLAFQKLFYFK